MSKKTVLVGINAKFIHSSLSIRCLFSCCRQREDQLSLMEFSINDHFHSIMKALYTSRPGVIAFSCYIWNIDLILRLSASLKKAKPELIILLGGPEVSFDPGRLLADHAAIDYIIAGEGEKAFTDFLAYINSDRQEAPDIRGLSYRWDGQVNVDARSETIAELDAIPFPYDDLSKLDNRILYYETSRGCPFNCQYCLSSTISGVRYYTLDRVFSDIRRFAESGVKQVKLVDRTFNCDKKRCVEIMKYIISLNPKTNFHFEIAADLVDEAFLETTAAAPEGLFQFEIGVQSTNPDTLREIRRSMDFASVADHVEKLLALGNVHLHLDLIAGLPFEDYTSFGKSFDDVFALKPHMLQLGFLKLLKGSGLRERATEYRIRYHDAAPYEVISTQWLSYEDILRLKDIEQMLDIYHNSGRFKNALVFLMAAHPGTAFGFFEALSAYWNDNGYFTGAKSSHELYVLLYRFAETVLAGSQSQQQMLAFNEYIKLDWLLHNRYGNMPDLFARYDHGALKEQLNDHLRLMIKTDKRFQVFEGISFKDVMKHVRYEVFRMDVTQTVPDTRDTVVFFIYPQESGSGCPILYSLPLSGIHA